MEEWLTTPGFGMKIIYEEDRARVAAETEAIFQAGNGGVLQFRAIKKDGQAIWQEAHISAIIDEGGKPVGMRGVTLDITERKLAEESLRSSEDRNRAILRAIPDLMFLQSLDGNYLDYHASDNGDLLVPPEAFLGKNMRDVLPADLAEGFFDCFRRAEETGEPQIMEYNLTIQGEDRWFEARMVRTDGNKMLSVVREVTIRKQGDESLRQSEERFRTLADTAPVLIWMSDTDKLCFYFNQQWLDFTGREIERELGNGWAEGVYEDDYDRCLEIYNSAFDRREPFKMEYRLRRADGLFRWVYDSGTPRFSSSGEFLGYIGSCVDISDRKQTEEKLRELSGRLINAQEEERSRVARELHDDLNQRMALLSIELEQLGQEIPDGQDDMRKRVHDLWTNAQEISSEIHRLSYQLHPSKLDHLGLASAVKSLCDELSHHHEIRIEFNQKGFPATLPKDVTLCVFRIAQESLRNVIKHSGVNEARVILDRNDDAVQLIVSDLGCGFNTNSELSTNGLGFISMRERLRLVGGRISVHSEPLCGTQIEVSVPLK